MNFWEDFINNKMADGGHFDKNVRPKSLWRDTIWTVGWIVFKFDVRVLWVIRMIWLTFEKKYIKNKIADKGHFEKIATRRACGRDILWIIGWIAFKFYAVVL